VQARPLVHRRDIRQPVYALTFDDGPSVWTDSIRRELETWDARATFFVIGSLLRDARNRRTLRSLLDDGNEIGNHTYTHLPLTGMQIDDVEDEILRTNAMIERSGGAAPRYWRPPYLRSGSAEVTVLTERLGLREVHASIIPADYEWPSDLTAAHVLERLEPGDIVALHDGRPPFEADGLSMLDRRETAVAASTVLAAAAARGLRSVTISELLAS
jgi:peptidoglycan-N-acetylglucosamine deacetylase